MRVVTKLLTSKRHRLLYPFQGRTYCRKLEIKENEPIKYTTSSAHARKTISVLNKNIPHDMPWYQPLSVVSSVAVFLIYFTILREENDIDNELTKTLYDRIQGLEKHQLLQLYKYNKENGKSVDDIEKRLMELEAQ